MAGVAPSPGRAGAGAHREARRRVAARVRGTVQGVGFRPFAYRLAGELELGGFVLNDERGVGLEIEGDPERVGEFLRRLAADAPPLAGVESVEATEIEASGEREFRILASERAADPEALVSPDAATCADCLAELFDPADRRYRHPFVNCTDCGPRFTIVRAVPYDRPATTMAGFEMCSACRAEYEDPRDRRFHAQPNACPECGPRVRLVGADGGEIDHSPHADAIAAAAAMLAGGAILAVKGIGGYHLACRAADERTVAELRRRKHREDKPFALIARDLDAARELVALSPAEERLLAGRERPIVIARRRAGAATAAAVAPRCADLGVMLPHSPLHHLLAVDAGEPLVLTSGNVSEEPIAHRDEEAFERLGSIADAFLRHDRPIHVRAEDSVVRSLDPGLRPAPLVIRRSRGYVPESIALTPPARRPILACGAELKSTFCLAKGSRAWVSHHIGDLKNFEALGSFQDGVEHFERLFAVVPELVAHDLHPDYLSTRYALERDGVEHLGVQHHHAHLAACMAEHAVSGAAVGAIYDGSGYGPDGAVWGGEILIGDAASFSRVGMLRPVRLPGGDAAAREPWRMACAWLAAALEEPLPQLPPGIRGEVAPPDWEAVAALVRTGVASPLTTSVGRLFDAVAALAGLRARVGHEGQAAMELEAVARLDERAAYPLDLIEEGGAAGGGDVLILDPGETIRALAADLQAGVAVGDVSARFHNALAAATASACIAAAEAHGVTGAVLSGGVFQNRLLLERTAERLRAAGLRALLPERLPPNDGGISYGQAAVAAARVGSGS
jgi:hydrogenase maturation protein HypF